MLQFGKVIDAEVFELNKRANDAENDIVDSCLTTTSDLTLMGILSNSSNCILTAISNGVLTTLNLQFTNDHSNKAAKVYILGISPLRIGFLQKSSLLFVLNLASYFKNNKLPGTKVAPNNASKVNSRLSGGGAKPVGFLNLEETLKTATAIINIKQYNYVFPSFIFPLNSSNQHSIHAGTSNELILCGYSDGTISLWDTGKKQDNCYPFDVINVNSAHTINSNGTTSSTSTNYSNIVHRIDIHSVTHVGFDGTRSVVNNNSRSDMIIITLHNQILIRTADLQSENIKPNHIASTTSNQNNHTFFMLQNRPDPKLYALYDGNNSDSGALRHLLIQTSPHHHTSVQYVAPNAAAHKKLTRLLHMLAEKSDGPAELGGGRNVLSNVVSIYDSATLVRIFDLLGRAGDKEKSIGLSDVKVKQSELVLSVDKHTQLLWLYAVPINCGSSSENSLTNNHKHSHHHNDTRTTTDHHDHCEQTSNEVPVFGFASVNLHTILNPSSNVSNGTDKVKPRKDVILNVSLLDSFLVVVCGHAHRHDCCTVTILRLDDLSVSRVYQLPVKEIFLSVQHPDRTTHTFEGTGSSSTSRSSSNANITSSSGSSSGNTELFIATHHGVYCLREDTRVATIIKHTTATTVSTTEQELNALGVDQVDMFYITQINRAQSAARAANHSEALRILADLLRNQSVSPAQIAQSTILIEAVKTGVTVEQAAVDSTLLPVTGVFTSPRSKKKKQHSSAGVVNCGTTAAVASGSATAAEKTGSLGGGGRTLSHSLFKYLNTLCIEYLIDEQTSVQANASTGSYDGANKKFFSLQTMLYESGNDCYFVNKVVARLLESNLEEEARKVLDRKHV